MARAILLGRRELGRVACVSRTTGRDVKRTGMPELDRIEHALSTKRLDADLFEDCAVDFLRDFYPGLSHVPGGTDSGRDADAPSNEPGVPIRFLITASRTPGGVRANLVRGLESMVKHGKRFRHLVLANPAVLSGTQRENLEKKAQEYGATIDIIYDRGFIVSRLRRDGAWRKALLGLPGHPIALSGLPSDLAESQWRDLPVVGRDEELSRLRHTTSDIILCGPPGAGKTRLAAAHGGQTFVDPDFADTERFADDLRFLNPPHLVIDDAGQHIDLVRSLVKMRRLDADLLDFRLIAVCWPDEVDRLRDVMPAATVVHLELLERQHVDEIVLAMGVTNNVARQEILDQAEGRAGWAVALADMLRKTQRWESLFSGRVLLGEVERYLRRAKVPAEAVDLLATLAALGGVSKDGLMRAGASLDLSRSTTSKLIDEAARGGIIDVRSWTMGSADRHYDVRPPMLADALVAEHVFRKTAPTVDLLSLAQEWPDRSIAIARAAVSSALLGAEEAVAVAHELVNTLRRAGLDQPSIRTLVCRYACINSRAATEALAWAMEEFSQITASEAPQSAPLEGVVAVATTVAGRELSHEAAILLLNAARLDERPPNSSHHPLQEIEQLIKQHHPDFGRSPERREVLARAADKWIAAHIDDKDAWRVYGAVIPHLLSLHLSGRFLDPGSQRTLHIVETIVPPEEARSILESIWPPIRRRLADAPDMVIREAVDVAVDWRHVGQGHDQPFGRSHPKTHVNEANGLSRKLLTEMKPLVAGKPGLSVYLKRSTVRLGVKLDIPEPAEHTAFYFNVERGDWLKSAERAHRAVEQAVSAWATEDPNTVIQRLVEIGEQLAIARLDWPDRVGWACETLVKNASNPATWAGAALDAQLPAGAAFLDEAVRRQEPGADQVVKRYLAEPSVRWRAIGAVLSEDPDSDLAERVVAGLVPTDYKAIEWLSFQKKLSLSCQRKLLTLPPPSARGSTALALARPVHDDDDAWPPPEMEAEWLSAIELLDPAAGQRFESYELKKLAKLLGDRYPATLYNLISARLEAARQRETWARDDLLSDGMRFLPAAGKTKLLIAYGHTEIGWLLRYSLAGDDVEWLAEVLDANLLTPKEALKARDGFGGPEPSLRDMAKLLIPRGVPPEVVADLAQYGTGWGEESDRAAALITEFSEYAADDDPNVSAMGEAGVAMYTFKRDVALEKERRTRIRGGF